jgi:hypothetical protein
MTQAPRGAVIFDRPSSDASPDVIEGHPPPPSYLLITTFKAPVSDARPKAS